MNELLKEYLDDFVIVYLDDILIFSPNKELHYRHLRKVLDILHANQLYCARKKCTFVQTRVEFLGYVVSANGICTDPKKTIAIKNWPTPRNVKELRSFLGLANYYRRFVKGYSAIAAPLTKLTKKDETFVWTTCEEKAFLGLKAALTDTPVLSVPNMHKPYAVYCDASDLAAGAVLTQEGEAGDNVIAYESRRFSDAETRYSTYEKELAAVVHALRTWRHYLEGAKFTVFTDHHALKYLLTQKELTRRQARWLSYLQEFGNDLEVKYIRGTENIPADALSRRPDYQLLVISAVEPAAAWIEQLKTSYQEDSECQRVLQGTNFNPTFTVIDGLIYKVAKDNNRLYIPASPSLKITVLQNNHDSTAAGHLGFDKTYERVATRFFWPGLRQDVKDYVKSCPHCQRNKTPNTLPSGLMTPLPIPDYPWEVITMDLIVALPPTPNGNDAVVTFVDKLTKMCHFVPAQTNITAPQLAQLFLHNVVRLHGLPLKIVSDRDARFTSTFWTTVFDSFGVSLQLSSSYHPETDGQSERANRTIEEMLRSYVTEIQDNWDELLTPLELAYNSAVNASTQFSPFFLTYGREVHVPGSLLNPQSTTNVAASEYMTKLSDALEDAKRNLLWASQRQKRYADNRRRDVTYAVGDQVLLSTSNLKLPGPARKFQPRYVGPFTITQRIGETAYRLELPTDLRIHNVFHVSKLKAFEPSPPRFEDRPSKPPPVGYARAGVPLYDVEAIIGRQYMRFPNKKRKQYGWKVKWQGYDLSDCTWEPLHHLRNVLPMVQEYDVQNPPTPSEPILKY